VEKAVFESLDYKPICKNTRCFIAHFDYFMPN